MGFYLEAPDGLKTKAGSPDLDQPSKNTPEGTIWLPRNERMKQQGALLVYDEPWVRGDHIDDVSSRGRYMVNLELTEEGAKRLSRLSQSNRRRAPIALDGEVWFAPKLSGHISGGSMFIEGDFSEQNVRTIVPLLNSGTVPGRFEIKSETEVVKVDRSLQEAFGRLTISLPETEIATYEPLFLHVEGVVPRYEIDHIVDGPEQGKSLKDVGISFSHRMLDANVRVNGKTYPLKRLPYHPHSLGRGSGKTIQVKELADHEHRVKVSAYYVLFLTPDARTCITSKPGTYEVSMTTRDTPIRSNTVSVTVKQPSSERERAAAETFVNPDTRSLFAAHPKNWPDDPDLKAGRAKLNQVVEQYPTSRYAPYAQFLLEAGKHADALYFRLEMTDVPANSRNGKNVQEEGDTHQMNVKEVRQLVQKRRRQDPEALRSVMAKLPAPSRWHLIAAINLVEMQYGKVRAGEMSVTEYRRLLEKRQEVYPDVITDRVIRQYMESVDTEQDD